MSKHYDITIDYLDDLVNMLLPYRDDMTVKKDLYNLDVLRHRLANNFKSPDIDSINSLEQLNDDIGYYDFYKIFYPFVKKFSETGLYMPNAAVVSYNKTIFSNDRTIKMVQRFFEEQGLFFADPVLDFFKTGANHIKFIQPSINTEGEMYYLSSLDEHFIITPNHPNFTKLTNASHETEHVIDTVRNESFYQNVVIREAPPMFMEMISSDFYAKQLRLTDANYMRRFYIHSLVKANSYNIFYKNQLLYLIHQHSNLSEKELLLLLFKKYKFDSRRIDYLAEYSITEDYYYQISYLIAVELYMIYQTNKERALAILQEIILTGTDDNILSLLEKHGIILNNSIVQYENDLCLKLGIE